MAKFTQTYQTDLKYTEWELIQEYFPPPKRGRPRQWDMWLIINAILYVVRTSRQWRMLPKDLPPKQAFGWTLEITRLPDGTKGFVVLARRWVVERTFGRLGR